MKIIKRYGTAYAVSKKTGIEQWKISRVLNNQRFLNPDDFDKLVESNFITRTGAWESYYLDGKYFKGTLKTLD